MSTFRNCEKLKELFIPNSVEMMFDDLSSCYGLEKLTFEEGGAPIELSSMDLSRTPIKELIWGRNIVSDKNNPNKSMYFGGKSLERAILGNSLTFIPAYAFAGCSKLTHILMPSFLTEIRSCAFSNCTSLEQINIPSIVKVIGKHAFWNCYNLQKLSSTSEDGVFELPQDVDSISIDAFKNCSAIRELVVPFACRKMSLAFEDCYSIVKVTSYAPVPPEITKYTFENKVYNNATLICPTPEAYKVAEGWKYFGKIVASSDTSIPQISQQQDNTSIYDLKGRQRHINDGYQKGIYIVNGKKVMLSK